MLSMEDRFNVLRVYKAALEHKSLADEQFHRAENAMFTMLKEFPRPEEEEKND